MYGMGMMPPQGGTPGMGMNALATGGSKYDPSKAMMMGGMNTGITQGGLAGGAGQIAQGGDPRKVAGGMAGKAAGSAIGNMLMPGFGGAIGGALGGGLGGK